MVGGFSLAPAGGCCAALCCCTGIPLLIARLLMHAPRAFVAYVSWRDRRAERKDALQTQQLLNAENPGSVSSNPIDLGLLRACHRQTLGRLLRSCDEGLLSHIASFLLETPPPILVVSTSGVAMSLAQKTKRLHSSERFSAFASDSSGEAILLGAPAERSTVLIYDLRQCDEFAWTEILPVERKLRGLTGEVTCLWLDFSADRMAVGEADGTVHIWTFLDGFRVAKCEFYIWESTRWTTTGHADSVCALASPPEFMPDFHMLGPADNDACVASGDRSSIVCLWRMSHCLMYVNVRTYTVKLGLPSAEFASMTTSARGLIICGLDGAVVGLIAPVGDAVFVLAPPNMLGLPTKGLNRFCAVLPLASADDICGRLRIVGATKEGAFFACDVENPVKGGSGGSLAAQRMDMCVAPSRSSGLAAVSFTSGLLSWISSDGPCSTTIRWLGGGSHPGSYCATDGVPLARSVRVLEGAVSSELEFGLDGPEASVIAPKFSVKRGVSHAPIPSLAFQ